MMFSFTCQNYVLTAYKELTDRSTRRMAKVCSRHMIFCSFIYLLIGIYGYITFVYNDPKDNILIDYNPAKRVPFLIVSETGDLFRRC